jgi:hypothetical protein
MNGKVAIVGSSVPRLPEMMNVAMPQTSVFRLSSFVFRLSSLVKRMGQRSMALDQPPYFRLG